MSDAQLQILRLGTRQVGFEAVDIGIVRLCVPREDTPAGVPSYAIRPDGLDTAAIDCKHKKHVTRFVTPLIDASLDTESGVFTLFGLPDGEKLLEWNLATDLVADKDGLEIARQAVAGEVILGLGEAGDALDRFGRRYTLWNTDDPAHHPLQQFYCQIPFHLILQPGGGFVTGVFVDNPGRQTHRYGFGDDRVALRVATGVLDVWMIVGRSIGEVLDRWTRLTGRPPRPPHWALGHHQSRWSYESEARVRAIADGFRTRHIPCDVIHCDIDYMDGYRVFTWSDERFPDPARLMGDLAAQGFRVVTIVDPGVKIDEDYTVYRDLLAIPGAFLVDEATGDLFTGKVWPGMVHFPDFTHPKARARWAHWQELTLLDKGVAGIWNDMNEPAEFDNRSVPGTLLHHDHGARRTHAEIHQVYGLTMAETSAEGLRAARPNERPFVLTRSGWAGIQRASAVWCGDNASTWSHMPFDIMLCLSLGLSGVPFVGCDIGGFGDNGTPELYARWIEWGAFQPFCRTHSATGTRDQEPWSFGPEVESIARRMLEWRMTLLPYLYTLFVESSDTGAPIMRPMGYESTDARALGCSDQFLLGRDILVAPIVQQGARHRLVDLPSTSDWYEHRNGVRHPAGARLVVDSPLGEPPVFIRAGAIVPMMPVREYIGEEPIRADALEVWLDAEMSGSLVEDDGITEAWRDGAEARRTFSGFCDNERLVLRASPVSGGYAVARSEWTIRVRGLTRGVARVTGGEVVGGTPLTLRVPENSSGWEVVVHLASDSTEALR